MDHREKVRAGQGCPIWPNVTEYFCRVFDKKSSISTIMANQTVERNGPSPSYKATNPVTLPPSVHGHASSDRIVDVLKMRRFD